jgi:hypothetical protein
MEKCITDKLENISRFLWKKRCQQSNLKRKKKMKKKNKR